MMTHVMCKKQEREWQGRGCAKLFKKRGEDICSFPHTYLCLSTHAVIFHGHMCCSAHAYVFFHTNLYFPHVNLYYYTHTHLFI